MTAAIPPRLTDAQVKTILKRKQLRQATDVKALRAKRSHHRISLADFALLYDFNAMPVWQRRVLARVLEAISAKKPLVYAHGGGIKPYQKKFLTEIRGHGADVVIVDMSDKAQK